MLKIGDFSKLSRISVRMLRHYDEIGLLRPVFVDQFTDYRYYAENQLPIVGRITALKDMGFRLAEISSLLALYDDKEALDAHLAAQQKTLETLAEDICQVTDAALAAYNRMRSVEGVKLAEDIAGRADTIEDTVARVEAQSPQTVSAYRERLESKMREVLASTTIDEARILTETAIFADKIAVDEETVRLHSHLSQLRDMLQGDEPVGRKLDFLIQEINRECNTIGSKCSDLTITQDVVNMKAEVEKIREQVQNIE